MDHFGKDQDKEIVELLGRLRETGPEYPPRLYAARRAAVLAALAALPLGGIAAASLFGKLSTVVKAMSVVDKVILAVEVVAITAVAGVGAATAYVYRDELKSLILGTLGVPTAVVSPIPSLSPLSTQPVEATPEATPSESPTPTGTIVFTVTEPGGPGVVQPPATDVPAKATPTRGLHLGQTKTPKSP
jgi:hypothetical protein